MDATRVRALVEAALDAQRQFDVALAADEAARKAVEVARETRRREVGNLKAIINDTFVIYGDKIVRVGNNSDGIAVFAYPLVSCPVIVPPPEPLPEAPAAPPVAKKAVVPTSGGVVPPLGKKIS